MEADYISTEKFMANISGTGIDFVRNFTDEIDPFYFYQVWADQVHSARNKRSNFNAGRKSTCPTEVDKRILVAMGDISKDTDVTVRPRPPSPPLLMLGPSSSSVGRLSSKRDIDLTDMEETGRKKLKKQAEQFTVLSLLFVIIVIGNISVLLGLTIGKRRKSRMNFFIMQLAFADLMVGLISVLTDIVWRSTVSWYAGNVACKIIRFLQAVVTYSSTYVLVALSIDRYDAITRPMNFSRSWCRARALVTVAWGLSFLFSVPIIFLYEEKIVEGKKQCWIDLGSDVNWRVYMTIVSFILFFIPAIIISACYMVIVWTIWRQSSALRQDPTRDTRRASSRGLIPRAKIKTVKMTFVIVFVFILCWSPYIVFDLLQVYGYVPKSQTNIAVATFIQSLAPLNSAANPLIYCLFSTPLCKTIRNMQALSWFSGLCPSNPNHCFGTNPHGNSTRTTVTTSLTAHSSRRSGHLSMLNASSRKRVMVSLV